MRKRMGAVLCALLLAMGCRGPLPRQRAGGVSSVPRGAGAGGVLVRREKASLPDFFDDADRAKLLEAVQRSAEYFRSLPSDRTLVFGQDSYSAGEMAESLDYFYQVVSSGRADLSAVLQRDFVVYSSLGNDGKGTVVFSAYYEHSLRASLQKTARFCYPLYGRPSDLEEVGTGGHRRVFQRTAHGLRPYPTRREIDTDRVLAGRGLEIAWAEDPVEIFFLQVQGSGWLILPDGSRVRVRYGGHNGHPYRSVGGSMIQRGLLSREKFSRKALVDYLSSHPQERQDILNLNPRYVFFKIDRGPTQDQVYGSLGVPLTAGRSVAMDPRVFVPGALAWMETSGPHALRRFVLNQDEGGAIQGPARVDFFAGGGEEAETFAVRFWEKGRLYFPVRRSQNLSR